MRTTHEFACCFGQMVKKQRVTLSKEQLAQFYQGLNLEIDPQAADKGEVLLCYQGHTVGLGQNQKGKLKNGLSRELVKDNFRVE